MEDRDRSLTGKIRYVDWVDCMKALLIIAVVAGHSTSPLVTYIYLFHMPAFFILSGYTYNGSRYCFTEFVRKKFFTVLLPAILINVIYIIFYSMVQRYEVYSFLFSTEPVSFQKRMTGLLLHFQTTELGGATWFLFVLFEVQVLVKLFEVIAQKIKCPWMCWGICLLAGSIGYLLVRKQKILPYDLDLAFMACLYFGFGICLSGKSLSAKIDKNVMLPVCILATIFFGSFYFHGKLPMNWPTREFTDFFIQLISCFAASYLVYYAAASMNKVKYLQWLGRHTYCILVMHFAVFKVLFVIGAYLGIFSFRQVQQLTPDAAIAANGGWILISILTVCLCSMIAWLAEKNPWLNYLVNARLPN